MNPALALAMVGALYGAVGVVVLLNDLAQAVEQGWGRNVQAFPRELGLERAGLSTLLLALVLTSLLIVAIWPLYVKLSIEESL